MLENVQIPEGLEIVRKGFMPWVTIHIDREKNLVYREIDWEEVGDQVIAGMKVSEFMKLAISQAEQAGVVCEDHELTAPEPSALVLCPRPHEGERRKNGVLVQARHRVVDDDAGVREGRKDFDRVKRSEEVEERYRVSLSLAEPGGDDSVAQEPKASGAIGSPLERRDELRVAEVGR